ncbi:MAG TPA: pyridoxamine 5'-phosphate oxidase family protein [Gemmatimonadales bacterium]|jgi:general stress protein 26
MQTSQEDREHLTKLVKEFRTAMLVTCTPTHEMHARPLTLADTHNEADATICFPAGADSGNVAAVRAMAHVNVTMQDGNKFVSLTGMARVSQDRALIDRLWSDAWKVWFPDGKSDPNIAIIVIAPHSAEYWDNSGAKGIRYMFSAAKAALSGERPTPADNDQHAKVRL